MGELIAGGVDRRVQKRTARRNGFTEERKQIFLDHLAGCCNLTRAAKAAGVSTVTVNNHRRSDPLFARQCEEALDAGYASLEAMMIERAATGGYEPGPGAEAVPGPETLDKELALNLLRLRRKPAGPPRAPGGYEPKRASEKELNAAILAKLDVLGRRLRMKRRALRDGGEPGKRRPLSPTLSPGGRAELSSGR